MSKVVTFNQTDIYTKDNKYSQKDLIGKIKKIVASKKGDAQIVESVINSFVMNGIVEIYNELGYQKWVELIHQIIDHEIRERSM